MRRSRKMIGIAAGVVIITLVLACGVIALVPRNQLTQQEIERRAEEIAQNEYSGVVHAITARQITQAELSGPPPTFCARVDRLLIRVLYLAQIQEWDNCDPNQLFWEVELEGEFETQSVPLHKLEMTFFPTGNYRGANELFSEEPQP